MWELLIEKNGCLLCSLDVLHEYRQQIGKCNLKVGNIQKHARAYSLPGSERNQLVIIYSTLKSIGLLKSLSCINAFGWYQLWSLPIAHTLTTSKVLGNISYLCMYNFRMFHKQVITGLYGVIEMFPLLLHGGIFTLGDLRLQ